MTITLRFPTDLLLDVLATGIDWSCRENWGQVETTAWEWWYARGADGQVDLATPSPELTPSTVLCRLREDSDGEAARAGRAFTDVTLARLHEALDWAVEHYPHLFNDCEIQLDGTVLDLDYDAIGADVVLQRIVFGEVLISA